MRLRLLGVLASVTLVAAWTAPGAAPPQSVKYTARMTGAKETPANTVKGTGSATFTLTGNELHYTVTVHGLSGPATAAHIHVGKAGASGPPVYVFHINKVADGTLAEGSADLSKEVGKGVSGDSLKVLLNNGSAYVNVHTAAHPGGEIRGQVTKR
jgi:Cu/Zn superoxide dismutase